MRNVLRRTSLLLLVYASAIGSSAMGVERYTIREIVHDEFARASGLTFSQDAEEWAVEALSDVESSSESELRQGFHAFVRAFSDYASERGLRQISRHELAEFQATAATCGMIPCPRKCCRRCEPC